MKEPGITELEYTTNVYEKTQRDESLKDFSSFFTINSTRFSIFESKTPYRDCQNITTRFDSAPRENCTSMRSTKTQPPHRYQGGVRPPHRHFSAKATADSNRILHLLRIPIPSAPAPLLHLQRRSKPPLSGSQTYPPCSPVFQLAQAVSAYWLIPTKTRFWRGAEGPLLATMRERLQ